MIIDFLLAHIFTPLWPLGIVFPVIATVILFRKQKKKLIFYVPLTAISIWGLVRLDTVLRLLSVPEEQINRDALGLDIPIESMLIGYTIFLAIVFCVLSILSTWITYLVLKKMNNK